MAPTDMVRCTFRDCGLQLKQASFKRHFKAKHLAGGEEFEPRHAAYAQVETPQAVSTAATPLSELPQAENSDDELSGALERLGESERLLRMSDPLLHQVAAIVGVEADIGTIPVPFTAGHPNRRAIGRLCAEAYDNGGEPTTTRASLFEAACSASTTVAELGATPDTSQVVCASRGADANSEEAVDAGESTTQAECDVPERTNGPSIASAKTRGDGKRAGRAIIQPSQAPASRTPVKTKARKPSAKKTKQTVAPHSKQKVQKSLAKKPGLALPPTSMTLRSRNAPASSAASAPKGPSQENDPQAVELAARPRNSRKDQVTARGRSTEPSKRGSAELNHRNQKKQKVAEPQVIEEEKAPGEAHVMDPSPDEEQVEMISKLIKKLETEGSIKLLSKLSFKGITLEFQQSSAA